MPQFPSPFSASGIWSLKKHKRAEQGDNWPYGPTYDPQFNYVTALLSNSSTDASRNNTFLDSSTNNFTITRNGNVTQGTFTPYGPNWSNFFGSGQYLTMADATQFNLSGGTFTIECWVYPNGNYSNYNTIVAKRAGDTAGTFGWELYLRISTGVLSFANNNAGVESGVAPPANTWSHVAAVYDGTNINLYLNGTRVAQGALSNNNVSSSVYVGTYPTYSEQFFGYLSSVRITKGAMLYTGTSYTVPSGFLTTSVPSGTVSLLTCQSNRFIDTSSNAAAITVTGTPSVQRFSPFAPTDAYSVATIGGSGYFDGSGDFLNVSNTGLFGAGDWTLECWVNAPVGQTDKPIVEARNSAGGNGSTNGFTLTMITPTEIRLWSGGQLIRGTVNYVNQWVHIAVVKSGSTTTMYLNGVSVGTTTSIGNMSDTTFIVGAGYYGDVVLNSFGNFYTSNMRVVKGSAVYTANFTPPTTPVTAIANTALLLNFTNGNILNAAAQSNFETIGDAQTNTSVTKYTVSTYFDGNGDCLSMPLNDAVQFRNSNFTVEMWVYPLTTNHQSACLFVQEHIGASNTPISLAIWLNNGSFESVGNRIGFGVYNGSAGNGTWTINAQNLSTISINTWTHVALSRVGDVFTLYINGNPVGGATSSTSCSLGSTQYFIGRRWDITGSFPYFNGYISEFRITRGYARYWAPFTPPTAPLPVSFGQEALPTSDPLYEYVALHLAGNGTNGAQNNTFVDSSTNAFAITRNGNTSQGTFSPYGTSWSNYFDGSGDNLTVPAGQAWNFGTGPFTIEAWLFPDGDEDNSYGIFNVTGNTANEWALGVGAGLGNWGLYFYWGDHGRNQTEKFTNIYPQRGVWSHVAVTRDANSTWRFFINGVALATSNYQEGGATWSDTRNLNNVTNTVGIGYDFKGHISNLRVVKGAAVYTSNFTPSNAPLTAIANTSLLTCQSNRFIDNSGSNLAITRNGDVSIQRFSPFNPTAEYSAATIGGSGYFDGSGDWLNYSGGAANTIGTSTATVEFWMYPIANDGFRRIITSTGGGFTSGTFIIRFSNGSFLAGSGGNAVSASVPSTGQWHHIAWVGVNGTSQTLYINGVSVGTAGSYNLTETISLVGGQYNGNSEFFAGYLTDTRVVKGTAVYTSNFTPPTTPLSAIANTSLLLNFTNSGIIDNAMMNDLETMGNAQISTTQSKFGGASLYFDGSGDSLATPSSPLFSFDGDVTIECWIYASALTGVANSICGSHSGLNDGKTMFYVYNNGRLGIGRVGVNEITSAAGTITTGVWYHVAAVKYGSVTTLYVNGARVASGTTGVWSTGASNFYVSYVHPSNGNTWNGYIDDLRITRGVARYVQSFPVPTRAHLTA